MRNITSSFTTHHKTTKTMATYVLPLPGTDTDYSEPRYSLDNQHDLIDYIDSSDMVREMLSIDETIGYGIYRDIFNDFYVVADIQWTWSDILDRPGLDYTIERNVPMWGDKEPWKPSESDWEVLHKFMRNCLANILSSGLGRPISADSFIYTIRRNGPRAKVFKVIPC